MLPRDSQFVGNGHCSFGMRMSLNSKAIPQVAPSLILRNSVETNIAGEVIHGFVLNPIHSKFFIVPNGVGKSLTNISALFLKEQKGTKEQIGNSYFVVIDGLNGTFVGNDVWHRNIGSPNS